MEILRKLFLLLVCWSCSFVYCEAQSAYKAVYIEIGFPNIANKAFFAENPLINSLTIDYRNGKPVSLAVQYRVSNKQGLDLDEFYDLGFAGDLYLLTKKHKSFDFLPYPKVGPIDGTLPVTPETHSYRIKEIQDIDSIRYRIVVNNVSGHQIDLFDSVPITASYRGGNEKLTSDIAANCAGIQNSERGSEGVVLLYRGIVHRDGSLQDVKPIIGIDSDLSNAIQNCVEATSGSWLPELQGGRPVKSLVDIFVQINRDLEVSVSFSALNRR